MKTHRSIVAEPRGKSAAQPARTSTQALLDQYECGPVALCGTPDASDERHVVFDNVVRPEKSDPRQRFEAVAGSLRDLLSQRWLRTDEAYDQANPKQVYYLSLRSRAAAVGTTRIGTTTTSPRRAARPT